MTRKDTICPWFHAKRVHYHVVPWGNQRQHWAIKRDGLMRGLTWSKSVAVAAARAAARAEHACGAPTQLVVHDRAGRIQWEATYGNDPYPPRG